MHLNGLAQMAVASKVFLWGIILQVQNFLDCENIEEVAEKVDETLSSAKQHYLENNLPPEYLFFICSRLCQNPIIIKN